MSFEEMGRALDRAIDSIAVTFRQIVERLTSFVRGDKRKFTHKTACAKRKRQPHVKRSYIRR